MVAMGARKQCEKTTRRRFHALRHTTTRNLNRAGVPDRIAMPLMGHKTRVMHDRYNVVNEDDRREVSAQLQAWPQDSGIFASGAP
jgi:integrase